MSSTLQTSVSVGKDYSENLSSIKIQEQSHNETDV